MLCSYLPWSLRMVQTNAPPQKAFGRPILVHKYTHALAGNHPWPQGAISLLDTLCGSGLRVPARPWLHPLVTLRLLQLNRCRCLTA